MSPHLYVSGLNVRKMSHIPTHLIKSDIMPAIFNNIPKLYTPQWSLMPIPGSSAGWKSSPNPFRLKFHPESCKPQIFARMDFGYFGPIQQDRCLEWIDNQSLDCHRDEQHHIFKLGGSQMGNNDVSGYVALVFRFFSPEWREILPFWCLISPEVKSTKLPKKRVRSRQPNFLQPAQITSWLR